MKTLSEGFTAPPRKPDAEIILDPSRMLERAMKKPRRPASLERRMIARWMTKSRIEEKV